MTNIDPSAASTQLSEDNHYVPQTYLKQWAHNGKIPTYRLLVPSEKVPLWKNHSLRGIAFRKHLYTYHLSGRDTDEFEHWLNTEFEDPAVEALDLAVRDQRLSPDHWKCLVRFAVAQDVRTPARLRRFLDDQHKALPHLLNETLAESVQRMEHAVATKSPLPAPSTSECSLFPSRVDVTRLPTGGGTVQVEVLVGRRLWLWSLRRILTETIRQFPQNEWTILRAPTGITWPTSDNPVVRLNYYGPTKYDFGGGWGVRNGDVLLPLSPKHLLHTCIGRKRHPRGMILDHDTAVLIRRIIVEHADQYIFSIEEGDIHQMRPRVESAEIYNRYQAAWKKWQFEQREAEAELHR